MKRKILTPLAVLVVAVMMLFASCEGLLEDQPLGSALKGIADGFSKPVTTPPEIKAPAVTPGNVFELAKAAAKSGNPDKAQAILDGIAKALADGTITGKDKATLQAAAVDLALKSSGILTGVLGSVGDLTGALSGDGTIESSMGNVMDSLLDNIDTKKMSSAADSLKVIFGDLTNTGTSESDAGVTALVKAAVDNGTNTDTIALAAVTLILNEVGGIYADTNYDGSILDYLMNADGFQQYVGGGGDVTDDNKAGLALALNLLDAVTQLADEPGASTGPITNQAGDLLTGDVVDLLRELLSGQQG
jgi:hypothetical protein